MNAPEPGLFHVPFLDLPDLAAEKAGGAAILANDEFFAPKENLLHPGRGVWIADKFTDRGKWMDGWETRRRRTPGHDWCVIRLGMPGVIRGVNVDTDHFLGNFPEYCSLDACAAPAVNHSGGVREQADALSAGDTAAGTPTAPWKEILAKSRLKGGTQNLFPIVDPGRWTHVRLNIYPDGGVARFRVHGDVKPDWRRLAAGGEPPDLAAVAHGGSVVTCNDMFFGPKDNLIMPGRAANMGEGWETRRRRGPGHDWIIVRLGCPGTLVKVEVDTAHFKGNYPDSCSLEACLVKGKGPLPEDFLRYREIEWVEVLPRTPLKADTRHFFDQEVRAGGPFSHVRLNIYPDGGVSRLRLYGRPDLSLHG